ncbi:MAG: hypothetical protein LBB60_05440 [Desulfovibrio sp.]|nr:hypothetical protein [Desulfovibrio sp.]
MSTGFSAFQGQQWEQLEGREMVRQEQERQQEVQRINERPGRSMGMGR